MQNKDFVIKKCLMAEATKMKGGICEIENVFTIRKISKRECLKSYEQTSRIA